MTPAEMHAVNADLGLSIRKKKPCGGDFTEFVLAGKIDGKPFLTMTGFAMGAVTPEYYRKAMTEEIRWMTERRMLEAATPSP